MILWFANYVKRCLCLHDLQISETTAATYGDRIGDRSDLVRTGIKISVLCKKCGYHKSQWKF